VGTLSPPPTGGNGKAGRDKQDIAGYPTVRKRVASLKPSPENKHIYRPVTEDPDGVELMDSIRKNGLFESLIVTADNYIVAGHRRYFALKCLGKKWVACRVLPVRRDSMTTDEYIALLREHNRQRHKSVTEQAGEELIDFDPEDAHRSLLRRRYKSVNAPEWNGVEA
jgi:hypothetical protein